MTTTTMMISIFITVTLLLIIDNDDNKSNFNDNDKTYNKNIFRLLLGFVDVPINQMDELLAMRTKLSIRFSTFF